MEESSMTKIVINVRYGGFGLSEEAETLLQELGAPKDAGRAHPSLVKVVEQLGEGANGPFAKLKVVEIPDDVAWQIEEYDGREWVAEEHRTWD
jgi:hypothetical protein